MGHIASAISSTEEIVCMKTQSVVNVRLVEDKERLLLNFVFSLWFEKELEKVNAGSNAKKKKRYAKLDPFKMVVEPPVIFKGDYFYACAADRPGGTLLIDKKVPYLTLETFLEKAKLSDKVSQDGTFNQTLADAVKNNTVTFKLLSELISSSDNLSTDPIYYLTQIKSEEASDGGNDEESGSEEETEQTATAASTEGESDAEGSEDGEGSGTDQGTEEGNDETESGEEYFVIFDSKDADPDFDALVSWIFRDYTFEEITLEAIEEGDDNYPTKKPDGTDGSAFYTGKVTVKDATFKEKTFTFNFIDMKLLATISTDDNGGDDGNGDDNNGIEEGVAYLTAITPNKEYDVVEPTANPKVVGQGTQFSFTKRIDPKRVVIDKLVDDLGNDLTDKSEFSGLVLAENANATTAFSISDFDYAFSFKYKDGNHRSFDLTAKVGDSEDSGKTATILYGYELEEDSITPVVESLDLSKGLNDIALALSFLDKSGSPIEQVVPQMLGNNYQMFDADGTVKFAGYQTEFGKKDDVEAKNILAFTISIGQYGSIEFNFDDPAIKNITVDIIDSSKTLTVKLIEQKYVDGKLSLSYHVIQDNESLSTDAKKFTVNGSPLLVINDTKYEPTTEWTETGFTNTYDIGTEVDTTNVTLEGQLSVGANEVVVDFTDTIEIGDNSSNITTATISELGVNAGYIYPSANKITENVCSGSLIIISEPNQVTVNDLELVAFVDAVGTDITDKATTVFTALNDDGTQFSPSITLTDYQWPMSFDNQGSNGYVTLTFGIKNKSDTHITATSSYKLSYTYEGITPRVVSSQLTNNSLNNAKIFVTFKDNGENVFKTGLEQSIPINPPLFSNSEVTYIGDKITYGENDDGEFGAFIPVNFKRFGNFDLSFADTSLASVVSSVADPNTSYKLRYYDEKFIDNGDFTIRFALYDSSGLTIMNDGKNSTDGITLTIDGQPVTINTLTWDTTPAISTTLVVQATIPEGVDKSNFDIDVSGQWLVGTNNIGVNVTYSGSYAAV